MYWTTLEISAPRCALMCYPSSNITYCIACLLCIGVILLNKFNSIQFNLLFFKYILFYSGLFTITIFTKQFFLLLLSFPFFLHDQYTPRGLDHYNG